MAGIPPPSASGDAGIARLPQELQTNAENKPSMILSSALPITALHIAAPLRIDFCGGHTDIAEISRHTGTAVVSLAIDLYADPQRCQPVLFEVVRRDQRSPKLSEVEAQLFSQLNVHFQDALPYAEWLHIRSQMPVSTGLGASGALCVMLIAAARICQGWSIEAIRANIFVEAQRFEKQTLQVKGGFQDFLSAIYGGYNLITARAEDQQGQEIQPLEKIQIKTWPILHPDLVQYFHSCVYIIYALRPTSSSKIIDDIVQQNEQTQRIVEIGRQIFDRNLAFHHYVEPWLTTPVDPPRSPISDSSPSVLAIRDCLRQSWQLRQSFSKLAENSILSEVEAWLGDTLYCAHGVGSGGSVLVLYGKPDRQADLQRRLAEARQKLSFQVFHPGINNRGLTIAVSESSGE